MAGTLEATRLTEQHRQAQLRLARSTTRQMSRLWQLLNPVELDATSRGWTNACLAMIDAQRVMSGALSSTYYSTFRLLEIGPGTPFTIAPLAPTPLEAIATSLRVTGPVAVKQATARGVPLAQAMNTARARSAAAATRHSLNGGRDLIIDSVELDRQAIGWARVLSGGPCAFCALVASRGPVYTSERTADFEPHDGCTCSVETVYDADAPWPPGSQRYADLYQEATQAEGDTLSNFRQLVEHPTS
jgi:hypothetical protein